MDLPTEEEKGENIEEEETEEQKMSRSLLYDKSRRSMSMLHPSQKDQLQNLLLSNHDEGKEEEKQLLDHHDGRRNTVDMRDFYDERPNNAIFLETSKE